MNSEQIINNLTNLNLKLKEQVTIPIIKNLSNRIDTFIEEDSVINIKQFIIDLNKERNKLSKQIQKAERSVTDVDIKASSSKKNKLNSARSELNDLLFTLHNLNCNIKQTLISIIEIIK